MSRLRYLTKRVAASIVLIFLIMTFLFFFFRTLPGDYGTLLVQSGASQESVEAIRAQWGLDDPLHVQYVRFLENILTGSAGTSHQFNAPVTDVVIPAMLNSIILVAPAIVVTYILGALYGTLMASNPGSKLEKYGVMPPTLIGTTPDFFIGIILIFLFASTFDLFPASGMASLETYSNLGGDPSLFQLMGTTDFWLHYTLPFTAIILKYLYYPTLIMRSSVVEVKDEAFMFYHRMTGLSSRKRFRHLLRHASLPVITIFPQTMTRSISGLVLIEVVFNWPGIGKLLVDSVLVRDTPIVQFVFIIVAVWVVIGNFLVDLSYGIIDPRISIEGEE